MDESKYIEDVFRHLLDALEVVNPSAISPFLEVNSKGDDLYEINILVKLNPPHVSEVLEGGSDEEI